MGFYIHIPFCVQKCGYCDFISYAGCSKHDMRRYVDALCHEIEHLSREMGGAAFQSVFIGGGTPTVLFDGAVGAILETVKRSFQVDDDAEITIEGNPGTLRKTALREYRDAGVNRISLGVQAAQDTLLARLGRIHTRDQAQEAVRLVREAGFANLNLDIMFGLPGQTGAQWDDTLDWVCSFAPQHVSCYGLIVEEGTPFGAAGAAALDLPGEEDERAMYHAARHQLERAGYRQYEISNFAREGRQCRHNLVYWHGGQYLGVGVAARSLWGHTRYANLEQMRDYLEAMERGALPRRVEESLSREDAAFESVMLSLRLTRGLDIRAWEARFAMDFEARYGDAAHQAEADALLKRCGGRIALTDKGMDLMDQVLLAFMEE